MRILPVISTISHAVKSTANNLPFAFHASWPWLIFLVPMNIWAEDMLLRITPPTEVGPPSPELVQATLVFYAITFLSMLIYASVAVSWHRYILKDEVPQGAQRLRLDGVVWRYVGNTILVGLMVLLMIVPLGILFGIVSAMAGGVSTMSTVLAAAVMVLVAAPVSYRLSLKLPAIALGNAGFRFGDAWRVTSGNMQQLMLLAVLSFGGALLAGFMLDLLQTAAVSVVGETVGLLFRALKQLGNWVLAIFTITLLTSLYGYFVEARDF